MYHSGFAVKPGQWANELSYEACGRQAADVSMLSVLLQYAEAGLNYARRNRRRIAFLSLVGIGVASAFVYGRRQYQALTDALDEERAHGARSLHFVYNATRRTIASTIRALEFAGKERIFSSELANSDELVMRLRGNITSDEKKRAWDALKIASVVRLVSSMYFLVIAHVTLCLQLPLVARYSAMDDTAPTERVLGEQISIEDKQAFLSLARMRLFQESGIEKIIQIVCAATEECVGCIRLSERVDVSFLRDLLKRICKKVNERGGLYHLACSQTAETVQQPYAAGSYGVLSANWLLSFPNVEADSDESLKLMFLVNEALDMCDVLRYDLVIQHAVDVLVEVAVNMIGSEVYGVSDEQWSGGVPLASVVAKLSNACNSLTYSSGSNGSREQPDALSHTADNQHVGDSPFVSALLRIPECDAFSAAVFLSGEKDDQRSDIR